VTPQELRVGTILVDFKTWELIRDVASRVSFGGNRKRTFPSEESIINEVSSFNAKDFVGSNLGARQSVFHVKSLGVPVRTKNTISSFRINPLRAANRFKNIGEGHKRPDVHD
jgi:hypothetical protein